MSRTIVFGFLFAMFSHLAVGETAGSVNADYLRGLTQEAFVSTNDFENLKVTIERLQNNAESCADSIVDLQLGLSGLSNDERVVREKDLDRIISDYSCISSGLVSLLDVERQAGGTQTDSDIQSKLDELEAELAALQTYVRTYLSHLTTGDRKWYFIDSGFLAGTNNSFTADASVSQFVPLVGQTFRTKTDSVIKSIKIRLSNGIYPPPDRVFISPYNSRLSTNSFFCATSVETNEAPVYTYNFPNFHAIALAPYMFGLRSIGTSPIGAYRCDNEYVDYFGYLCVGNFTRANPTVYDMSLQYQYDLCFDMVFQSGTNMVVGAEGIELQNDANIKINGNRVATIQEVNARITEAAGNIHYAISNHVFGTSAIANESITSEKLASDAVTTAKISDESVTEDKIALGAITAGKISANAVTTEKINNSAVTADKIASGAITENKMSSNAVTASKISDGSITAGKIATGAITENKISANAVTTEKINNSAVTADKIASGAITENKMSSNAVTTEKINDGSITAGKIASGAITETKISANAVTTEKINDSAVTAGKIADGSVIESKINTNSVTTAKISDGAVTSSKIANSSITQSHISNDLRNNLITTSGGTVTGRLNVHDFYVNTSGDWVIGDSENVANILIGNSDGVIASSEGDLKLQSVSGRIEALNFLNHSNMQTWYATVNSGSQEVFVNVPEITENAIILLTPCQKVETAYWAEIDVYMEGFYIRLGDKQASNCKFNYCIMRK